jgi:glycosyltransferase involved in cell wall biosynthesis
LRPEKNHTMFLRVASLVHRRMPVARFLIVGDGPERPMLESLAQQLGVAGVVRFLGTRRDVPKLLSLVDVLLLTSHSEANPICLLEAMAAGKPVVSTRVGSVTETVLPGQNGFLVDPGDTQGMADRVCELLTDRRRAAEMGRVGREYVVAHGSVDRMVGGYEEMIAEIYESKSKGLEKGRLQLRTSP